MPILFADSVPPRNFGSRSSLSVLFNYGVALLLLFLSRSLRNLFERHRQQIKRCIQDGEVPFNSVSRTRAFLSFSRLNNRGC